MIDNLDCLSMTRYSNVVSLLYSVCNELFGTLRCLSAILSEPLMQAVMRKQAIYVRQPPSSHLQQSKCKYSGALRRSTRRAEGIWLAVRRKMRQSLSSWLDLVLGLVGSLAAQLWIAMVPRMHLNKPLMYLFRCILLLEFGCLHWILKETSIRQPSSVSFNPDYQTGFNTMYRRDHQLPRNHVTNTE